MGYDCECVEPHLGHRIVLTGGPGAGKTAVLELVRATACQHVQILPEAAGIIFSGGFPRRDPADQRRPAQRAIFHVQRELEALGDTEDSALVLCDRGTPDGLAYWPGDPRDLWETVHTTLAQELERYDAVIHLRTPTAAVGYNRANPVRTETAEVAARIDDRIATVWSGHAHLVTIAATSDFLVKADAALAVIGAMLPGCCRQHTAARAVRQPGGAGVIGGPLPGPPENS